MRKWLALLLASLMLLGLVACGGNGNENSSAADSAATSSEGSVGESSTPVGDSSTPDSSTPDTSVSDSTDSGSSTPVSSDVQIITPSRDRTTNTTSDTGTTTTTTRPAPDSLSYSTENESPVTYDTSILYNEMHSESDDEAAALKKTVLNATDAVKPSTSGTTYYVSYKGNDKNDGKSKATAWRTTKRVGEAVKQLKSGDVVLFERGGVYRGTMMAVSGLKIGAYGSGSKPQLYAGPCNVAQEYLWQQTKYKNVWKLSVKGISDIGNVVFDHGKVCASTTRMMKENLVTDSSKNPRDFYYYHNVTAGYVYMYYSKGNPGAAFDSIELCPKDTIISAATAETNIKNVVVDNLCLRYSGAFGVAFRSCSNITVTNCEVGYIGGSLQNASTRYGNGIELNGKVNGATIKNNWIYQCYDAGYTHQCGGDEIGIRVDANLIEYCNYNIEFFLSTTGRIEAVFENNILRFAGYGFGTKNRYGSNDSCVGNVTGTKLPTDSAGSVFRNNIFDTSLRALVMVSHTDGVNGPKFEGNTYIQWNDTNSASFNLFNKSVSSNPVSFAQKVTDEKSLKDAIAKVDSTATVVFYKKK